MIINLFHIVVFSVIWQQIAESTSPALILTPLINKGLVKNAREASAVDRKYFLNVTSYSGLLTVDEKYNSNSFFWYFPAPGKEDSPWIVWLQGGPGASSLYGVFDEIGPFEFKTELKLREWTWTSHYPIVFIDNPIGSGFSFTDSEDGFARNMSMYSNHLYTALQQFLKIFPELRKEPLYIAGESYAGHYIPGLATEILNRNQTGDDNINLHGVIMGNPVIEREDISDYSQLYYQWGLIDSQGVVATKPLQDAFFEAISQDNYTNAFHYRNELLDKLEEIALQPQNYNVLKQEINLKSFMNFLSKPDTKEELHVGSLEFSGNNGTVANKLIPDFLSHMRPMLETLLDHYRVLIYCGHLDLIAPCIPNAEARRKKWHWTKKDQFMMAPRQPWWYNESVAGYTKSGGGLTEVLIRDAGHLVPTDKPAQLLQLVSYFIRGLDMPLPPNYSTNPNDTPPYQNAPVEKEASSCGTNTVTILSLVFNFIFVCVVIGVIIYKFKVRRNGSMLYQDSVRPDSILNLA